MGDGGETALNLHLLLILMVMAIIPKGVVPRLPLIFGKNLKTAELLNIKLLYSITFKYFSCQSITISI